MLVSFSDPNPGAYQGATARADDMCDLTESAT